MFKVISNVTGKVVSSGIPTEREAKVAATDYVIKFLGTTTNGKRILGWSDGKLSDETARCYASVQEMQGDWVAVKNDDDLPGETTEESEIVFTTKKGKRFLGFFDAEEVVFVSDNEEVFSVKNIAAYLLLPDND